MPNGSFRDPAGFVFFRDEEIYRQINQCYQLNYDFFLSSGLFGDLTRQKLLLPHEDVDIPPENSASAYKIIKPLKISFISYPYEWSFSQLKDAALLTLKIQIIALEHGLSLKDASAFNIQFYEGKPIFIDTLSFEKYEEGYPWIAYRQFCQNFLAPLAIMSYKDARIAQLLNKATDGIAIDLAISVLPFRSWFNLGLACHLHLHSMAKLKYSSTLLKREQISKKISKKSLLVLVHSLIDTISYLKYYPKKTQWSNYYSDLHYIEEDFAAKQVCVTQFIRQVAPEMVWDLGANEGIFSRLASDAGAHVISIDNDFSVVEKNYLHAKSRKVTSILPLYNDLSDPSSGIGWMNEERKSLLSRGPADLVMALALMHHLIINYNLPFSKLANFFAEICHWLIIEYVPKDDPQAQKMLWNRKNIFGEYIPVKFEEAFGRYFRIVKQVSLPYSSRKLYLMQKKS